MKNRLNRNTKSCTAKTGRHFLALLLSCVMIFSLTACGGQKELKNTSIWGKYTLVSTYKENEPETSTIIMRDNGNGTVSWEGPDGKARILPFDQNTNTLHWEDGGFVMHIEFSLSDGKATGTGYTSATLFGETQVRDLTLTKISD